MSKRRHSMNCGRSTEERNRLREALECSERDEQHEHCRNAEQQLEAQLRVEREENARLRSALQAADVAINPPDKHGISLHEWNHRLKAATATARAALFRLTAGETPADGRRDTGQ